MKKNKLTAQEVEDNFNSEKDLTDFFTEEVDPVTHSPKKTKISAELPSTMVRKIDAIVAQTGNTRNAVIRMLIAKSLESKKEENYLKKVLEKLIENNK